MSEKKSTAGPGSSNTGAHGLFDKQNLMLMLAGVALIAIGMFLMVGGNSNNPGEFKYEEVYSVKRITVAPILIIVGLVIEIYAIFKKTKD